MHLPATSTGELIATLDVSPQARAAAGEALRFAAPRWEQIDSVSFLNTLKVLEAYREQSVSEAMLGPTTGYGYGDCGREALDKAFAKVTGSEKAIVRLQFVSGTHAVACALFAALHPGDELLSLTGAPYDTLRSTISGCGASLESIGVTYREANVIGSPRPWESAVVALSPRTRAVFVQKSRGYSDRPALSSEVVGRIAREVRSALPGCVTIVDNCYGEFVETSEPTAEGADLIAGSLIKNPGGGLAPAGGYVAGRSDLVDAAAERLTAPGIGGEVGASLGANRAFFQGLFLGPHVVAQALKGAVFFSRLFENLGFPVDPDPCRQRYDLVQAIDLGSAQRLNGFCSALQAWSPVDSHVTPVPGRMPGYDHDVIMAAGTFVQGSSIELSADAPFEPPYRVYVQGGLCLEHAILAAVRAADAVLMT